MKIVFKKDGLVEVSMDAITWHDFVNWVNKGKPAIRANDDAFRYLLKFCRYITEAVELDERSGQWIIKNQAYMGKAAELALYLMRKNT